MEQKTIIGHNPFDNSYIRQMYYKDDTNYYNSVGIVLFIGFILMSLIKKIVG